MPTSWWDRAGKLRAGNIDRSDRPDGRGFDTDLAFLAAEIFGDELTFNAISRTGRIVDPGVITRIPVSTTAAPPQ